jgi:serine/threonine-protein kinase CHEK1
LFSVFRAVNVQEHLVAACKLISLSEDTTERERKAVDKEMRVHSALKHIYVLEFLNAVVVEPKLKHRYVPGIYMLLEFAAGGDLFDKIGTPRIWSIAYLSPLSPPQHPTLVWAKT